MLNICRWLGVLGVVAAIGGCGGSKGTSETAMRASELADFVTTLPDGSPMVLQLRHEASGKLSGSFAVAADKGIYARQGGSFIGSDANGEISGTCTDAKGNEFQVTGASAADGKLNLTRSDIPGKVLNFAAVKASAPTDTRADLTFFTDGGGTTGRMIIKATPFAVHNGGAIVEYRGTWNTMEVTVWAYSNGLTMVVTRIDALCLQTSYFLDYPVTAFATKTVTSGNGQMTMYNTSLRQQIKFKTQVVASP